LAAANISIQNAKAAAGLQIRQDGGNELCVVYLILFMPLCLGLPLVFPLHICFLFLKV